MTDASMSTRHDEMFVTLELIWPPNPVRVGPPGSDTS